MRPTGALKRKLMLGVAASAILVGVVLAIVTAPGSSDGPASPQPERAAGARDQSDLALAASYIGISTAQLRHELNANSTLAEIANATPGHSASGLMDALFAARAAHLSAAVIAGRLSKAKQASRLAKLPERLNAEIHRHRGRSKRASGTAETRATARVRRSAGSRVRSGDSR